MRFSRPQPGTLRQVQNEREIFDLLGMPYVKPEEREYKIWGPKYIAAGTSTFSFLPSLPFSLATFFLLDL